MALLYKLINEVISEIASQDDLKSEISTYKQNSAKIAELQKSIEDVLKQIKAQSTEETKRLKLIQKYMEDFNVSKLEGDSWVAKLEEVPMFKYPSLGYKELWEAALSKLNENTKNVLKELENAQLADKTKATKKELTITENFVSKGINWIINKWKGLLTSIKGYKETVKALPEIK